MTPQEEEFIHIFAALLIALFLFWLGAYLETCRKRFIEKVNKKLDRVDNIDPC